MIDGASYLYDKAGNRTAKTNQFSEATDRSPHRKHRPGNRTAKTNQFSGDTEQYAYDPFYQLTQVTQGALTTESYAYDQVGNRVSSLGQGPYTYNVSNELLTTPEAGFTCDLNGNTSSKTDATGTTQYQWDFENRLISANLPGGGGARFKSDPFGRRIQKSTDAQVTNYFYDDANVIAEVDMSGMSLRSTRKGQGSTNLWPCGGMGQFITTNEMAWDRSRL